MNFLQLVCLDFDGTVMVYDDEPGYFHPGVIQVLNELKDAGINWCTNSGRNNDSQLKIIQSSQSRGLTHNPSALLCNESVMFIKKSGEYVPNDAWNEWAYMRLRAFHKNLQEEFGDQLEKVIDAYCPEEVVIDQMVTAFHFGDEPGKVRPAYEAICEVMKHNRDTLISLNGGWLAIFPMDLGKGNVLRRYIQMQGYQSERVLAIGDQVNDVSMLDGKVAGCVGCPGSSAPEIIDLVNQSGGYVAQEEGPLGTLQVIRHYLNGHAT